MTGGPWSCVRCHYSHNVKRSGLPISLLSTFSWYSQWWWTVKFGSRWRCNIQNCTQAPGKAQGLGASLEPRYPRNRAHFGWCSQQSPLSSSDIFVGVLICLAWWDTSMRDGPSGGVPDSGRTWLPHNHLSPNSLGASFRGSFQPGQQHRNAAQLVSTTNNSAVPLCQLWCWGLAWVTSLHPRKTLFHGKRNWSSGSISDFLNLPESGQAWIQTHACDTGAPHLSHYHFPLCFTLLLKIQADTESKILGRKFDRGSLQISM